MQPVPTSDLISVLISVLMSMDLEAVLVMAFDPEIEVTTDVVDMVGPCSDEAGDAVESTSDNVWG